MGDKAVSQLRHKVTLASIAAVLASVVLLIAVINYANHLQSMSHLRQVMDEIASSADTEHGTGKRLAEVKALVGDGYAALTQMGEDDWHHGGRQSASAQYGNRFFFVIADDAGNTFVKAKGQDGLTDDEAAGLAGRALATGTSEGMLDDYLFAVEDDGALTRILFLDCTTEVQAQRRLLAVSVVVGTVAVIIASGFVFHFSSLAVRPLEESVRRQKRFVADAGHELKTPLTVIATNMDILEVDLEGQPEELEWVDSTNRQVANMRDLVADLISLSKMEEGEADLVLTDVSLSDVADECVLTFAPVAAAQGIGIVADVGEGLTAVADEPSVRRLMTILIDNAVKYVADENHIFVTLRLEGRQAVFETRNAWARDVDARELPFLFDRFVRGDRARDRSDGARGYGLGLSIARALAEANRVGLTVAEDEDDRIVFRATFTCSGR